MSVFAIATGLALQSGDPFEAIFSNFERGTTWTYEGAVGGRKLVLTLLKKEKERLLLDAKETVDGEPDGRAVTLTLELKGEFITLEKKVDEDPSESLRVYKLGSKQGDTWDGTTTHLGASGKAVRLKMSGLELHIAPDTGLLKVEGRYELKSFAKSPWNLLDLSGVYTGTTLKPHHPAGVGESEFNDLSSLPRGVQTFSGVPFDVRGVVQLAGASLRARAPEKVEGIRVGGAAARLHFLHAAGWCGQDGIKIGSYVVRYKDGKSEEIAIVSGEDVSDWWQYPRRPFKGKRGQVVWIGSNPACRNLGGCLKLYKGTWENPRPDAEIESLEYFSAMTTAAPFLIAVTAQEKR